ncbi:MAG: heavy metal translocating P-type ATPase [Negativicutes bacterium]|nr:heavy metal translocating P-type ATPase [Negativicutes bacterium]
MTDRDGWDCPCCEAAAAVDGASIVTSWFVIDDLDCADCAAKLEKGLHKLPGVMDARVVFATARAKVAYNSALVQPADVLKVIGGYGYQAQFFEAVQDHHGLQRTVFRVDGLDCGDCAAKLEKAIAAMAGVRLATLNFGAGKLTVEHSLSDAAIIQTINQLGYQARRDDGTSQTASTKMHWWASARTKATVGAGVLLTGAVAADWAGGNGAVAIALYAATAVVGGYHPAKSGLYGLRSFSVDMNFLMTVAIVGAAANGEWSEGAVVAFLFALGNTLQTYTMDKTRRALRTLMDLTPSTAWVRRGDREERLPVAEIVVGDTVFVKPGEQIAVDGVVLSGSSAVNQAAITGESLPVEKTAGVVVYAGTINGQGALEIEVTRIAADSTLARIMHLVEEAQAQKAPAQQFVDRFARYYTPVVLLTAVGVMTLPWLFMGQPFAPWFYKGLVLLVISCPCALVISTPVSIVAAIGNASRRGVLIKGGAYLERVGAAQVIAFDKTGTLTEGRPEVTAVLPLGELTESELLATAAAVEKWSEHPLAQAVVTKAAGLTLKPVTHFQALFGRGACADLDGQTVWVGNRRLFEERGHSLALYESRLSALEADGQSVMLVGTETDILGFIAVADTLRPDSAAAMTALRQAGMRRIAMFTGDNRQVAAAVAARLELDAFYSDLLPEDKVAAVKKMRRDYGSMIMVGDGVNDAPALAAADIGVAMGAAGSDAALETADIALMADDLGKLAYIIRLSRKTVAVIKENIWLAIVVKVIFVALTFAGLANLWLAVFADMGSSLLVTLNGMRLMRRLD